jgi:hypothetical protein
MKWLPTILAVVGMLVTAFTPQFQAYVASHPAVMAAVAGVYSILTHLLPSPIADEQAK